MICPNCNKDNPDNGFFCTGCGYNFQAAADRTPEQKPKKNKKKVIKIAGIAAGGLLVLAIGGFFGYKQIQLNRTVNAYKTFLDKKDYSAALAYYGNYDSEKRFVKKADAITKKSYEEAVKRKDNNTEIDLFNSGLLEDKYIEELEKSISEKLEKAKNQFIKGDMTYSDADDICSIYEKYENDVIAKKAEEVDEYIEGLNTSRDGYEAGMKAAEENNYEKVLYELSKVIEADENYAAAKAKMEEVLPAYKTEVFANVETAMAANNFAAATNHLESLQKYCSDPDVPAKLSEVQQRKAAYEGEQERIKIEGYKNNQEVEVLSTKVYNGGHYLRFMKATSVVRNNTNKVAKEVDIGLLLFDGNGYPVDVEYKIYQGKYNNEFRCAFDSCNILPGNQYGSDRSFDLPDQCSNAKACVRRVIYTDGSTWDNPYYSYWLEDNYNFY